MRSKKRVLKDIDEQINNMEYALIDSDLDQDFPVEVKKIMIEGYKKRIKELEEIKKRLEDLLI